MAATTDAKPIPDDYRRVSSGLVVRDAAKALEFYRAVFDATERMRYPGPDDGIMHAEIQIGDAVVMVDGESPSLGTQAPPANGLTGTPYYLYAYVEDVDDVVARAVELGATLQEAVDDRFYGDRTGSIVDPYGHAWTIATHVQDIDMGEMPK